MIISCWNFKQTIEMNYLGSIVATALVDHALSPCLVDFFGIRVPPLLNFTWQMKYIIEAL